MHANCILPHLCCIHVHLYMYMYMYMQVHVHVGTCTLLCLKSNKLYVDSRRKEHIVTMVTRNQCLSFKAVVFFTQPLDKKGLQESMVEQGSCTIARVTVVTKASQYFLVLKQQYVQWKWYTVIRFFHSLNIRVKKFMSIFFGQNKLNENILQLRMQGTPIPRYVPIHRYVCRM